MKGPNAAKDITMETLHGILSWLQVKPFQGNSVHLMGGEPTLHVQFSEIAQTVRNRGFELTVFSNAATPKSAAYAEEIRNLNPRWVVNINPPESRTESENANLHKTLAILGEQATLTFNLRPEPMAYEWAVELIAEYGLAPRIKVGFVLPTMSHKNQHFRPDAYAEAAERTVEFAALCDQHDISLQYECGVPWCAFTPEQMGFLWSTNSRFSSCCNSILDITPDGHLMYCLPLANFRQVHYSKFPDYPAAKSWFEKELNPYRPLGTTQNCFACNLLRQGVCRGGCLAHAIGQTKQSS